MQKSPPGRWPLLKGLVVLTLGSAAIAGSKERPIPVVDPGFEQLGAGWASVEVRNAQRFAPPEGRHCALGRASDESWTSTTTDHVLRAGDLIRATVWVKRVNPLGSSAPALAALRLGGVTAEGEFRALSMAVQDVEPPRLTGAAAATPSDDGVNVWFDTGYRLHFGDVPLYQAATADPILDPWLAASTENYDFDNALGPIRTQGGLRAVYDCFYDDSGPPYESFIGYRSPFGSPPDYEWNDDYEVVLEHTPEEFPWVIDPHLFEDPDTGRLWMSWGGHVVFVTEMDPITGRVLGDPPSPEVDSHPAGTHTPILKWPETKAFGGDPAQPTDWCGDRDSGCYLEGPALFRHEDWWYALASYGNLGADYTIRMARAADPRGPYLDKDGVAGVTFDAELGRYGASMLIAPEGDQAVPGHPAIWTEGNRLLIGYDHRDRPSDPFDRMAIRELRIVDGWPTIWEPLAIEFRVEPSSAAIGERLQLAFRNVGGGDSLIGFDRVELTVTPATRPADLDGDGCVGSSDLGILLINWGRSPPPAGDLDGDGRVGPSDVGLLLVDWGC